MTNNKFKELIATYKLTLEGLKYTTNHKYKYHNTYYISGMLIINNKGVYGFEYKNLTIWGKDKVEVINTDWINTYNLAEQLKEFIYKLEKVLSYLHKGKGNI